MFSTGQLAFALIFFISFVGVIIWTYRKDLKLHQKYYKGSIWVFVGIILFLTILCVIKSFLYQ